MNCSIDRFAEVRAGLACRGLVCRAIEQLQLQTHGRERRTQLVRGVCNEGALIGERVVDAREQTIQLVSQWQHFLRELVGLHGREAVDLALLHVRGHSLQRAQPTLHDEHDGAAENRHEQQHRNGNANGAGARDGLLNTHRLRHLDHATNGLEAIHPPWLTFEVEVRVARVGAVDDRQPGTGKVHDRAAEYVPHLHGVVDVALFLRHFELLRQSDLAAEGQRHLPQLVVEDPRAFLKCLSVCEPARQQRRAGREGEEGDQEPGTNGAGHLGT